MPSINVYLDYDTYRALLVHANQLGRSVDDLASAAVSEAVLEANKQMQTTTGVSKKLLTGDLT